MMLFLEIVGYLFLILVAAEVFVNALEHLGEKLKISEGVTGSIFAAVGTALPETLVPLLAIFAGTTNSRVNEEIGVGAILGTGDGIDRREHPPIPIGPAAVVILDEPGGA